MSVLVAILYPNENIADNVLETVEMLSQEGHFELEDACALIKDSRGRIHLHQESNLSLLGAVSGLALGTFLGWFVWLPYLGIPGAIVGAMAGKVSDRGISDNQMKDLSREMQPMTSALFLLLRSTSVENVLTELLPYGGRIFHTSLSKAQELELEEKLEKLRSPQPQEADRSPEMHD